MSEALDEMFRSNDFVDMDKMTVIARMVEAEYVSIPSSGSHLVR